MSKMHGTFAVAIVLFLSGTASAQNMPSAPQSCERLSQLAVSKAKIVSAQTVEAGTFAPPAAMSPSVLYRSGLPVSQGDIAAGGAKVPASTVCAETIFAFDTASCESFSHDCGAEDVS